MAAGQLARLGRPPRSPSRPCPRSVGGPTPGPRVLDAPQFHPPDSRTMGREDATVRRRGKRDRWPESTTGAWSADRRPSAASAAARCAGSMVPAVTTTV